MKNLTDHQYAVLEEAKAILTEHVREEGFTADNPTAAIEMARIAIALEGKEREHFIVILLDNRHKMIKCVTLFSGTVDGCEIYTRVILQQALMNNASAIILAHNHPSGYLEPSAADHAATARIKQASALIDIRLLDHFIITDTSYVSFAERGWL